MKTEVKNGHVAAEVRPRRAKPWSALFFFLILAVVSALLHFEKSRWQKQALAARQQLDIIVGAGPIEEVKAQRSRFYKIQYYLDYPSVTSHAVADFVRRLSAAIPLHCVRDLQIDPGLQNFSFRLTIAITAAGPGNARLAAAGYLDVIRKFPEIIQLALAKTDLLAASGGRGQEYFYLISGQAEMQ